MKNGSIKRKFLYSLTTIGGGVLLFIGFTNVWTLSYGSSVVRDPSMVPHRSVVIVFGGGVKPDGSPSAMAAARLDRGIELYKQNKAETILITGDDGLYRVDEMTGMRQYALDRGVEESDIILDGHGYRTYESCLRANAVYGVEEAIAVSQSFHLSRIIYLCDNFGVHVVGVPADDHLPLRAKIKNNAREILARVKNWIDAELIPPPPPGDLNTRYIR